MMDLHMAGQVDPLHLEHLGDQMDQDLPILDLEDLLHIWVLVDPGGLPLTWVLEGPVGLLRIWVLEDRVGLLRTWVLEDPVGLLRIWVLEDPVDLLRIWVLEDLVDHLRTWVLEDPGGLLHTWDLEDPEDLLRIWAQEGLPLTWEVHHMGDLEVHLILDHHPAAIWEYPWEGCRELPHLDIQEDHPDLQVQDHLGYRPKV